ncbi:3-hydroxyacyl-CoA dehydrogenase NAD-binding domain-containing protein [Indioceanicola profundi]|uniref:3-hydroxyacyl-CoA dehydrogenase NAD-binding domain-containing protein n=1 Tax=Indioceanicola profundi TaxID=2220096 RepID=UPI000E6AD4AC|nr:3-hydroxyacyl-CoA dehydrogenase NAD-binding domain-containing protein [Indioceanicola profundi]
MTSSITIAVDAGGICTLTIDQPGRSMNVIDTRFADEFAAAVARAAKDDAVKGVLITSAKKDFLAGADLVGFEAWMEEARSQPVEQVYAELSKFTRTLRALETCGKPVACAINGTALGGGFEIALACHYRVAADTPSARLGLPEVQVGLLPGAGGTQRLPRMIGIQAALPLLLEGRHLSPEKARAAGLVHEIVAADSVAEAARAWLLSDNAAAVQPWDQKGFKVPGGAGGMNSGTVQAFMAGNALLQARTWHNYPAPEAIMSCVYEGTQLPMDKALAVEAKYFTKLFLDPVARNMIRTLFLNKGRADKLARRPAGVPKAEFRRIGMLGAGMMGGAIAYVAASRGIEVVLIDQSLEAVERGKGHAAKLLSSQVAKGRMEQADADAILARILPGTDYAALADADYVIEAVFEDREIKAEVTRRAEAAMPAGAIIGTNTSTLPITGLAQASVRPERFIGIHFFSPVDKMPLVEIIRGERTGEAALAVTQDLVRALGKTPIVVNDGRGFFTSRFCGAYMNEGQTLLLEGVGPALIENAGRLAGMPVGPLALADETALDLAWKIYRQWEKDLGADYVPATGWDVVRRMVEEFGRPGRKAGKGFYDYLESGEKRLWPGLGAHWPRKPEAEQPDVEEVKMRLLYAQAIDAVRAMEDGVLTTPEDGDVGAILGLGYAPWSGGPFSLIDTVGAASFVSQCEALAARHGPRFAPPALLKRMAAEGRRFYPRAAAKAAA